MSEFEKAIPIVLHNEGGLVDNPKDPGGITNFGISLRFLKSTEEYKDADAQFIRDLTTEKATEIYHKHFWLKEYDQIDYQRVCNFIFDMSVNMGHEMAHKRVQRTIWAVKLNNNTLKDDGIFGPLTITYLNEIGETIMPILRSERSGFYRCIVSKDHYTFEGFLQGWLNRCYSDIY